MGERGWGERDERGEKRAFKKAHADAGTAKSAREPLPPHPLPTPPKTNLLNEAELGNHQLDGLLDLSAVLQAVRVLAPQLPALANFRRVTQGDGVALQQPQQLLARMRRRQLHQPAAIVAANGGLDGRDGLKVPQLEPVGGTRAWRRLSKTRK